MPLRDSAFLCILPQFSGAHVVAANLKLVKILPITGKLSTSHISSAFVSIFTYFCALTAKCSHKWCFA